MRQGTTPTLAFKVNGYDLTDKTVFVSIKGREGVPLTKTGTDLKITYSGECSTVEVTLTQEETLKMRIGDSLCQIRFIDSEGIAYATSKAPINVQDVIYKAVIQYE